MQIIRTDSFKRDYERLSLKLQQRLDGKLELFVINPFHSSLRVKKMKRWGKLGVWEASFTKGYRFTFRIVGDSCYLRRVGPHDILRNP